MACKRLPSSLAISCIYLDILQHFAFAILTCLRYRKRMSNCQRKREKVFLSSCCSLCTIHRLRHQASFEIKNLQTTDSSEHEDVMIGFESSHVVHEFMINDQLEFGKISCSKGFSLPKDSFNEFQLNLQDHMNNRLRMILESKLYLQNIKSLT
ncbi:hypothetical protein BD560DRAFT_488715 [Blakeslea trispora]|nr:hypothetical protein BD560DRAFT_488715 [Blakeslea trispora]